MFARLKTAVCLGLEALEIEVEIHLMRGLPAFHVVGLPDASVQEARERVRSAIVNAGYVFPKERITVNLAPAHVRKEGTGFDLVIAAGILLASHQIEKDHSWEKRILLGELSLNGKVRAVGGVVSLLLSHLGQEKDRVFVLPEANTGDLHGLEGLKCLIVENLADIGNPLGFEASAKLTEADHSAVDMVEVKGQDLSKRAMEICAAGAHHLMLVGPPGSGKSMLARRFPGILPEMSMEESREVSRIHSASGLPGTGGLLKTRPFRSPHHTISLPALVGGGKRSLPGEVTLAHHGVLFLDEVLEFSRATLEGLRQPLSDGEIRIDRVSYRMLYPCRFTLLLALNPCPCGYFGDSQRVCHCTKEMILRYRSRLSGPLRDRIDVQIPVGRIQTKDFNRPPGRTSNQMRQTVLECRERQKKRLSNASILTNSQICDRDLEQFCPLDPSSRKLLEDSMDKYSLSLRSLSGIRKVARTIADLENSPVIQEAHLMEALYYRTFDWGQQ